MSADPKRPQGPDTRMAGGWTKPTPWGPQPATFFTLDNSYAAPGARRPKSVAGVEPPAGMPPARPAPRPAPASTGSVLTGSVLPPRAEPRLDLGAPVTRATTPAPNSQPIRPRDPRPTGALDVPPAPPRPAPPRPATGNPPPPAEPARASETAPGPETPFEVSLPKGIGEGLADAGRPAARAEPPRPDIRPEPLPAAEPSLIDRASEALAPAASVVTRATARKSTRRRRSLLIAGGVVAGIALLLAILLMTRPGGEPEPSGILPPIEEAPTAPAAVGSQPVPALEPAPVQPEPAPAPATTAPAPRPAASPESAPTPAPRPAPAPAQTTQPAPVRPAPVQTPPAEDTPPAEPILIPVEPLIPPPAAAPPQTDPDAPIVTRP